MARLFSIRPSITFKGRKFKGLRGWAGKPLHPPLTDIPVASYVLAAVFDLISYIGYAKDGVAGGRVHDFFVSATHVLVAGAIVSLGATLTGFWDWLKSTPKHTQAWRTANWHMAVMLTVTALVVADIVVRLGGWERGYTTAPVLVLSLLAGGLVAYGSTYGGSLVFDYGFNVETAGDHPVWHESETDVMPGER
jgi:uncharacterized membrane protein